MRVFLDTNIVLDFFLEREPFFELADRIFEAIARGELQGCISASTVTDIFYITKRQTRDLSQTRQILGFVLNLLEVCPVDVNMLREALDSGLDDFEDAVQLACAIAGGVEAIVTRNPQDFITDKVRVLTPSELVAELC